MTSPRFPYPTAELTGDVALESWHRMRAAGIREGFYPVIVGNLSDLESLSESASQTGINPRDTIVSGITSDAAACLAARRESDPETYEDLPEGEWPDAPTQHEPVVHLEMPSGIPKERVFIAKIPTTVPYEVPAFLRFGGWNDCPLPEQHVTLLKHWHEQYGAEILSLTADTIECFVARPPSSPEQALALANEQVVYCSDILFQGVENLNALAASLLNARHWFFWWD